MSLLEKSVLKLLVAFVIFLRSSFFIVVSIKAFACWFNLYTFLSVDLLYNISMFWYLFIYFILAFYFTRLFELIFQFKRSQMFFFTLSIISVFYTIRYYGLFTYATTIYKQLVCLLYRLFRSYLLFRKTIAPQEYSLLPILRSFFNTHNKFKGYPFSNNKESDCLWIKKFKEHNNRSNTDYIKNRKDNPAVVGVQKKKPGLVKKKARSFKYQHPKPIFSFEQMFSKPKDVNNNGDIGLRSRIRLIHIIKLIDKKKKNFFLNFLLNVKSLFFVIFDVFVVFLFFIFRILTFIQWKPMNARLPYFKKIKKNHQKKHNSNKL